MENLLHLLLHGPVRLIPGLKSIFLELSDCSEIKSHPWSDLRWSWISWIYQDFAWIIFYPWVFDNLYWSVALLVFFKRKLKSSTWCLKKIRTKNIFYFWRKSILIFFWDLFSRFLTNSFRRNDFPLLTVNKGKSFRLKEFVNNLEKNLRKKIKIDFLQK